MLGVAVWEIDTPAGVARAHVHTVAEPLGALVLGHGAGGGVSAPDLLAAQSAAVERGLTVALVEQPYRVAGKRAAAPAARLDAAWIAALTALRDHGLADLQVIAGGRSSGARVACRTASALGVTAVLCLAFPLQPPQRRAAAKPSPSRLDELDAVRVPVLVVQGARDRFGIPPPGPGRRVVTVPGDHSLRTDPAAVTDAVSAWLDQLDSVQPGLVHRPA